MTNTSHIKAFAKGIKPDPYIDLVKWSDTYRRLPKESSVEPGKYRSSRTPYVKEILVELSPQSSTEEVVFVKGTQIGATEIGNCFLFAIAHRYPGPAMQVFPTEQMAMRHSKKKIASSIRSMPCLKGVVKEANKKSSGNTMLLKEFPGGSWTFSGSNSPASARSDSIRYMILDDYDGFIQDAGSEGSPGDLFRRRTDAFGSKRKIYINSTPTIAGVSQVEKEWQESSQGTYHVPCPFCGEKQFLKFGNQDADFGIKFTRDKDGQIIDVWYVCEHCHKRIDEWQKTDMMANGEYIHKYPDRKKRGFKINSLYSPVGWLSWHRIMTEFLQAKAKAKKGNKESLKVWVNTRAAEVWEEDGDQPEWTKLSARAEPYKVLTVPDGGMMLVAGVDTQDDRLEVLIEAFGRQEESWVIYYSALYGDPDQPEVWLRLDELLTRTYIHDSGSQMRIESMAIDTGGHKTQAVYNYCRKRAPVVFAIKGASTAGAPVLSIPKKQDVDYLGQKIKGGVGLYHIGTDVVKGTIYNRLGLEVSGPGYCHFPIGLSDEFYRMLTAEKLITGHDTKGFKTQKWVKTRERNEVLDCKVYAYVAAIKAGLSYRNWDEAQTMFNGYKQKQQTKQTSRPANNRQRPAWFNRR